MRFFHEFKTAFLTVHFVPLSFFVAKRTCIMTMGISKAKQKDKEKRTKKEKPDKTYQVHVSQILPGSIFRKAIPQINK